MLEYLSVSVYNIIMRNLATFLYVLRGLFTVSVRVSYCPFTGQKKPTLNLNQPKMTVLNITRLVVAPYRVSLGALVNLVF